MTINKQVFVFDGDSPERLDVFASSNAEDFSRGIIQKMIKDGLITVNGKTKKPSWPLTRGEKVEIILPSKETKIKLKDLIIYEDKNLFVISKPAGLLVHPQSPLWETNAEVAFTSEETLAALILAAPPKNFEKDTPRAGLVHRLDKDTSGVMVIAKNSKTQEAMTNLFAGREVYKEYEAILCGELKEEGRIEVPIGRVAGGKIKASELGREAVTEYKPLKIKNGFTLARLHPVTGRTNQLRVHLSWLGYPVLGDYLYKGATASRLMLHARRVKFKLGKKAYEFEVAPPEDFTNAWQDKTK